jgi:hypothetical protein
LANHFLPSDTFLTECSELDYSGDIANKEVIEEIRIEIRIDMTRQQAEIMLQKTFGLPKFYDEQWQTIEKILNGERVLLIEKCCNLSIKIQTLGVVAFLSFLHVVVPFRSIQDLYQFRYIVCLIRKLLLVLFHFRS